MIWKYPVKCKPKIHVNDFGCSSNKPTGRKRKSLYQTSHVEAGTSYKYNAESFKSLGEISYFKKEFWFKHKLEVVMKNIRGNWKDLVKIIELTEQW